IYVPFGTEWDPYLMRRLSERPANLVFIIRSLIRERRAACVGWVGLVRFRRELDFGLRRRRDAMAEKAAEPHQETEGPTAKFARAPGTRVAVALEPAKGEHGLETDQGDGDQDRNHSAYLSGWSGRRDSNPRP